MECPSLGMLVGIRFPLRQTSDDEEEHVQPPIALKCHLHTSQAAISMVSAVRGQWTAEPVTADGEVAACPAGSVVTGLFDQSGALQTVELLLCAPVADGVLVSDRCYNLPTEPSRKKEKRSAEREAPNQCYLEPGEAWAVVGLSISTDSAGSWVAALRCCRIDAV